MEEIDGVIEALLEEPIEITSDDVMAVIGSVEDNPESIPSTVTIDAYKQVIVDFFERISELLSEEEEEEE